MPNKTIYLNHFIGNSLIFFDFELDLFVRDLKKAYILPVIPSSGITKNDKLRCPNFPLVKGKIAGIKENFQVLETRIRKRKGEPYYEVDFYFSFDAKMITREVPKYVYEKCTRLKDGALVNRMLHRDKMPPEAFRHVVKITKTTFKLLSQVNRADLIKLGVFNEFIAEGELGYNKTDVDIAAKDYFRRLWRQRYRVNGYRYDEDPVVAIVEFKKTDVRYFKNRIKNCGGKDAM